MSPYFGDIRSSFADFWDRMLGPLEPLQLAYKTETPTVWSYTVKTYERPNIKRRPSMGSYYRKTWK